MVPNTAAFLKEMGAENNLGILSLWLVPVVWPSLAVASAATAGRLASALDRLRRPLALGVLLLAFPFRLPPSPQAIAACDRFIAAVGQDLAAGKAVFINHGTAPLLANGDRRVPRFRAISRSELLLAGQRAVLDEAAAAFEGVRYDRVYILGRERAWDRRARYRLIETIPAPFPIVRFQEWMDAQVGPTRVRRADQHLGAGVAERRGPAEALGSRLTVPFWEGGSPHLQVTPSGGSRYASRCRRGRSPRSARFGVDGRSAQRHRDSRGPVAAPQSAMTVERGRLEFSGGDDFRHDTNL